MVARTRLLNCQKRLSQSFRRSARMYLGDLPDHLKQYSHNYYQELNSYKKITYKNSILDDSLGSQIILCGDYHSSPQAQRTVLRILRGLLPRVKKQKKNLYLGLEILRAEDNIRAQQLTRSEISEARFLEVTGFSRFGFNWQNYAPLLELAREWHLPLFGLSPKRMGTLQSRDAFAARMIAHWASLDSNSVLFCLMGDLHLAQKHLPREIKLELKSRSLSKRVLTIHQNHDDLYWKLVHQKRDNKTEVVQLKKDVFCILNTAPWIKLQSHLNSIEQSSEKEDYFDCSDTIFQLIDGIAYFLDLKKNEIGNGGDLDIRSSLDSRTYFSYSEQVFYVGSRNLNHLAKVASQYVHSKLSGFQGVFEKPERDFYPMIWTEALGYFGSKIINPKRKCQGLKDFKSSLEPDKKLAYRLVTPSDLEMCHQVAQHLGKLLGQALFDLMLRNQVSLACLKNLFRTAFGPESKKLYSDWCERVDFYSLRNFSFREKL